MIQTNGNCVRGGTTRFVIPTAILLLPIIALLPMKSSRALPEFSRRYSVPCDTCHTVAPNLNHFGLAFQANHFVWPGGPPPAGRQAGIAGLPVSGLATFSRITSPTGPQLSADFDTLELLASDGFTLGGPGRTGGYFVDYFAVTQGFQAGALQNAYVTLPVAGSGNRQWALTAGQFTPISYQYDPTNSLTQSIPATLVNSVDNFSFAGSMPGLRLEFSDSKVDGSASGNYLAAGVPFDGALALNSTSTLYSTTHGAYLHGFHRVGDDSLGLFGYERSGNSLEGLLGTMAAGPRLHLLGIDAIGRDELGSTDRVTGEADYAFDSSIALSGRIDSERGQGVGRQTYPTATFTYYPAHQEYLRLVGETVQQPGSRSFTIYFLGQY
jgi:hypothetical protein